MIKFEPTPTTLIHSFPHVWSRDPALDIDIALLSTVREDLSDAADLARWDAEKVKHEAYERAIELADMALLPLKEGDPPSVFWLRFPTGELPRHILDIRESCGTAVAIRRFVALCLDRIDNAVGLKIGRTVDDAGFKVVDSATLDIMEKAPGLMPELAGRVFDAVVGALSKKNT